MPLCLLWKLLARVLSCITKRCFFVLVREVSERKGTIVTWKDNYNISKQVSLNPLEYKDLDSTMLLPSRLGQLLLSGSMFILDV